MQSNTITIRQPFQSLNTIIAMQKSLDEIETKVSLPHFHQPLSNNAQLNHLRTIVDNLSLYKIPDESALAQVDHETDKLWAFMLVKNREFCGEGLLSEDLCTRFQAVDFGIRLMKEGGHDFVGRRLDVLGKMVCLPSRLLLPFL
jgi:hypothetical protein